MSAIETTMQISMRILLVTVCLTAGTSPSHGQLSADDLTRQIDWIPMRASSAHPDLTKNGDARPIPPGEELELADLHGPGVISHIWCTIGTRDIFHGRSHVLKIYYDGNEHPSVVVPLGDFFGVGHGAAADYQSAVTAVSSHGRARSCYWKMPFHERARVVVANDGDQHTDSFYFYVDWQKHESLPEDTVYFHAQYRQENPTTADDFVLLNTEGRGHYVGTVLSVQQAEQGWFGEGDDRFFVDGETTPSLSGTGTEDYFGDAWGFRRFHTPSFGVPLWEGYLPGDRVTAYRWHLQDPVPFRKSLRVQMETRGSVFTGTMRFLGQFLPRQDFVSGVACWYQWPPVTIQEELPPAVERIGPYRIIPVADLKATADPNPGFSTSKDGFNYQYPLPNGSVEVEFEVPEDGTWQVNAIMNYGLVGGGYQPSVNGTSVGGPIDFSSKGAFDWLWTRLDLHNLKAGETHRLKFTGTGRSPHTRTRLGGLCGLAMSHLVLLRLEDLPGFEQVVRSKSAQED